MAAPVCNTAAFWSGIPSCYRRGSINPIQQKALEVYAHALELAAIGGTNYLTTLTTTLMTDSACPGNQQNIEDLIAAATIRLAFSKAVTAGATVPVGIQAKVAITKCLTHVPGGMLRLEAADLWLNCKLGRHAAYPQ